MKLSVKCLAAVFIAVITIVLSPVAHAVVKGEKSFGPRVGYISQNESATVGLVFQYAFSPTVRISPEASCVFRNDNMDAFMADINIHFPLLASANVALYPLVGGNFTSWTHHNLPGSDNDKDVTTHTNRIGFNAGAGFELRCNATLKLWIEGRYTLMKSYSTAQAMLGIAYMF